MAYHLTQEVLFRHCDPAGIVFYPRYFEMVNDTVEAFFAEIGYPFSELHETHGTPTVELKASFQQPSRHGDRLDLTIVPTRIGGASLDLNVTCSCNGQSRFEAHVTLVHVTKAMKAQRWPEAVRARLESHLNPDLVEASNG